MNQAALAELLRLLGPSGVEVLAQACSRNKQAVLDLVARLSVQEQPGAMPPAAYAAFERTREERRALGLAGYTMLRADDAPDRPPHWRVIVGETVVASSKTWKGDVA